MKLAEMLPTIFRPNAQREQIKKARIERALAGRRPFAVEPIEPRFLLSADPGIVAGVIDSLEAGLAGDNSGFADVLEDFINGDSNLGMHIPGIRFDDAEITDYANPEVRDVFAVKVDRNEDGTFPTNAEIRTILNGVDLSGFGFDNFSIASADDFAGIADALNNEDGFLTVALFQVIFGNEDFETLQEPMLALMDQNSDGWVDAEEAFEVIVVGQILDFLRDFPATKEVVDGTPDPLPWDVVSTNFDDLIDGFTNTGGGPNSGVVQVGFHEFISTLNTPTFIDDLIVLSTSGVTNTSTADVFSYDAVFELEFKDNYLIDLGFAVEQLEIEMPEFSYVDPDNPTDLDPRAEVSATMVLPLSFSVTRDGNADFALGVTDSLNFSVVIGESLDGKTVNVGFLGMEGKPGSMFNLNLEFDVELIDPSSPYHLGFGQADFAAGGDGIVEFGAGVLSATFAVDLDDVELNKDVLFSLAFGTHAADPIAIEVTAASTVGNLTRDDLMENVNDALDAADLENIITASLDVDEKIVLTLADTDATAFGFSGQEKHAIAGGQLAAENDIPGIDFNVLVDQLFEGTILLSLGGGKPVLATMAFTVTGASIAARKTSFTTQAQAAIDAAVGGAGILQVIINGLDHFVLDPVDGSLTLEITRTVAMNAEFVVTPDELTGTSFDQLFIATPDTALAFILIDLPLEVKSGINVNPLGALNAEDIHIAATLIADDGSGGFIYPLESEISPSKLDFAGLKRFQLGTYLELSGVPYALFNPDSPEHGFQTGDAVVYDNGGSPNLGGLTDGTTYFVIRVDGDTIQLATNPANATNGVAIDLNAVGGANHRLVRTVEFDGATAVDDTTEVITATGHGLLTGDAVVYDDGGGTAIGGLADGETYYVIRVDADTFQLAATLADAVDEDGNELDLTDGVGADHTLTRSTPFHRGIDLDNDTITLPLNSFQRLLDFAVIGEAEVIAVITQLGGWLDRLPNTDMLGGFDIPFAEATLGELLDFGGMIEDELLSNDGLLAIISDLDEDILSATFATAQELAQRLSLLSGVTLVGNTARYEAVNPAHPEELREHLRELTYDVKVAESIADVIVAPVDFELDLEPVTDVSAETDVLVGADLALEATLGFSLSAAGKIDRSTPLTELNNGGSVPIETDLGITADADLERIFGRLSANASFFVNVDGTVKEIRVFKSAGPAPFNGASAGVVDVANDRLIIEDHGLKTGDTVIYSKGGGGNANIGGLSNGTTYFVIRIDADTFKLATSATNASNGTAINLTGLGTGTGHTLLHSHNTDDNTSTQDLLDDINNALATAGVGSDLEAVEVGGRIAIQAIADDVDKFQITVASSNPAFTELGLFSTAASTVFLTGVLIDDPSGLTGTASFGIKLNNAGSTYNVTVTLDGNNTLNDIVNDVNAALTAALDADNHEGKIVASRSGNRLVLAAVDSEIRSFQISNGSNIDKLGFHSTDLNNSQDSSGVFLSQVAAVFVVGQNFMNPDVNPDASVPSAFGRLNDDASFFVSLNGDPEGFESVDVDISTEKITITGHAFSTGEAVAYKNGGGTTVGGLANGGIYYVIKVDNDTIKLAATAADAGANLAIDLTSAGSGTNHSLLSTSEVKVLKSTTTGNKEIADLILDINAAIGTAGFGSQLLAVQTGASSIGLRAISAAIREIEVTSSARELGLLNETDTLALGLSYGWLANGSLRAAANQAAPAYYGPSADAHFTLNYDLGVVAQTPVDVTLLVNQTLTNRSIYELVADLNQALSTAFGGASSTPFVGDFDGLRLVIRPKAGFDVTEFSLTAGPSDPAVTELHFAASVEADRADLLIHTGDGNVHRVTLDDAVNVGDVLDRINMVFDPATAVSIANDTIAISDHNYQTGDKVTYNRGQGTAIGGLANGDYYVIRLDADTIQLANSLVNAQASTEINLTSVGTGNRHSLGFGVVAEINSLSTGLKLTDETVVADETTSLFRVESVNGSRAVFALGIHASDTSSLLFTSAPVAVGSVVRDGVIDGDQVKQLDLEDRMFVRQKDGVNIDSDQITIDGHGLQTGNAVVYNNGGGTSIGGLTNGTTYFVIRNDAGTILLASSALNATNGVAIDLTSVGTGAAHRLTKTVQFNGATAVDPAQDKITATGHGFRTGDIVAYSNGGGTTIAGLTNGGTYYVIAVDANTIQLATSLTRAMDAVAVDITADGIGAAHTLTRQIALQARSTNPFLTATVYVLLGLDTDDNDPGEEESAKYGFAGIELDTASGLGFDVLTFDVGFDLNKGGDPTENVTLGELYKAIARDVNLDDALDVFDLNTVLAFPVMTPGDSDALEFSVVLLPEFDAITLGGTPRITMTVTDAGDPFNMLPGTKYFDGSDATLFNTATDTFNFADHGFKTGDKLVYRDGNGTPIGGLVDNGTYFVIVVDDDHFQLATTLLDAIARVRTFNPGDTVELNHVDYNVVDVATDTIFISGHGLRTGDAVVYDNGVGTSIGGLTDGSTYFIIRLTGNTIKLAATLVDAMAVIPVAINLTSQGTGTAHTLTEKAVDITAAGTTGSTAHRFIRFDAIAPTVDVTDSGLQNLKNFDDVEFDHILTALQQIRDFLNSFAALPYLDQEIPVLGTSFNDLIDLAGRFSAAVDDLTNNPPDTIQQVEQKIRESFGLPPGSDVIGISLTDDKDGPGGVDGDTADMLKVSLKFLRQFTEPLMVELDLASQLPAEILAVFPDIALMGRAGLGAEILIDALITVGVDLDDDDGAGTADAMGQVSLFTNKADTHLTFALSATSTDIAFNASLGPLGVLIIGGDGNFDITAKFQEDGAGADARALIQSPADILTVFGTFDPTLTGNMEITLPVYAPTASNYVGDVYFKTGLTLTANQITLVTPVLTLPEDFGNLDFFENFGILSSLPVLIDALDLLLETVQNIMSSDILSLEFPVIGDRMADAAEFIEDLRTSVIAPFQNLVENTPLTEEALADLVQAFLFAVLGPGGAGLAAAFPEIPGLEALESIPGLNFLQFNGAPATFDDFDQIDDIINLALDLENSHSIWRLELGETYTPTLDFPFDLGFPGLGLDMEGGLAVEFTWALSLGFGISTEDGPFIDISGTELELSFDAGFQPNSSVTGKLGFLQFTAAGSGVDTAENNGAGNGIDDLNHIAASFSVDLINGSDTDDEALSFWELGDISAIVSLEASADLELALELAFNEDLLPDVLSAVLPSLVADFEFHWGMEEDDILNTGFEFDIAGGLELIAFHDIGLDLGSFLGDFLGPIVSQIQEFTDPLQPIIEIMTAPIPVVSDLAGKPISLVDIASWVGEFDPGLIYALADLISFVNSIPATPDSIILPIAEDFIIYGSGFLSPENLASSTFSFANATNPDSDGFDAALLGAFESVVGDSGLIDIFNDAGGFLGFGGAVAGGEADSVGSLFAGDFSTDERGGFEFPFLENPSSLLGVLLGQPIVLVTYDLPPLIVEFSWEQGFPIYGPLWGKIGAGLGVKIDVAFGYDTLGVQEFAEGNFSNPLDLLSGFFLSDTNMPDGSGTDVPELQFIGKLIVGAELNAGIASAGILANIILEVNFDLNDPDSDGRVRISELLGNFLYELREGTVALAPMAIFDVGGEIGFQLTAFLSILGAKFEFEITPQLTLFEFSIPFDREPILATERGDQTLLINIGPNSGSRLHGNIDDIGEEIHIFMEGDDIKVWSPQFGVAKSAAQTYSGEKIVIYGGEGDDKIYIESTVDIPVYFEGNSGKDFIEILGSGDAEVYGNDGDDDITGGSGDDTIYGQEGNDKIDGGEGDDIIFGDSGRISAELISVLMGAKDGDDDISGGADDDIIFGGGGSDKIGGDNFFNAGNPDVAPAAGTAGDDLIFGDSGRISGTGLDTKSVAQILSSGAIRSTDAFGGRADEIQGHGGADTVYAGAGDDKVDGGDDDDTIFGESGFDYIEGGDHDDTISGGTEDDVIYGYREWDTDDTDPGYHSHGDGDDTIYGDNGNDFIRGNDGDDTIHGGRGTDILFGDFDDDIIEGEADNDYIFGGAGSDISIRGGAGNDIIFGDDGVVVFIDFKKLSFSSELDQRLGNRIVDRNGGLTGDRLIGDGAFSTTDPYLAFDDGNFRTFDVIQTEVNGTTDGDDYIVGGEGDDIAMGGAKDDTIFGDFDPEDPPEGPIPAGEDILIGDGARVEYHTRERDNIRSIVGADFSEVGSDHVSGNGGNDVIFGSGDLTQDGGDGDFLYGRMPAEFNDDPTLEEEDVVRDDDIILGDDGEIDYGRGTGIIQVIFTYFNAAATDVGGDDEAYGNKHDDIIFGGIASDLLKGDDGDDGDDVILGDNGAIVFQLDDDGIRTMIATIKTTDVSEATGGPDTIEGQDDDDVILGGVNNGGTDVLYGDADSAVPGLDGQDVILGDNGELIFNADTSVSFRPATAVNLVLNTIGANAHGLETGDTVVYDNGGGSSIGGLANGTVYFVIVVDANTIKLATTALNATNGNAIDLTSVGSGTSLHRLTEILLFNGSSAGVVSVAGDTIVLTAHELVSGDTVRYSAGGGTAIVGLTDGGVYHVIVVNANTIKLAATAIDVTQNQPINLTGLGAGTNHSFLPLADLDTLDSISSYADGLGGGDEISGGAEGEVLIGGNDDDLMFGDDSTASGGAVDGEDIMLGDNGDVIFIGSVGRLLIQVAGREIPSAVDLIITTDTQESTGGADTMSGNARADIMLGGVNDGGTDTLYGDRGGALPADQPNGTTIGNDGDDVMLGDNGLLDFTFESDTNRNTLDLIRSFQDALGGVDVISGNRGLDVAIGGTAGDTIYGDNASANAIINGVSVDFGDLLLGDNADIFLVAAPAPPFFPTVNDLKLVLVPSIPDLNKQPSAVKTIRTTDTVSPLTTGGRDTISGNAGGDIIAGGVYGDTLYGDRAIPNPTTSANDGDDIILGDNGAFEWLSTGRIFDGEVDPAFIQSSNPTLYNWFTNGGGGFPADTELRTLDLVTTEQPNSGGRDTIYGDEADDMIFGGTDLDIIHGDDGNEILQDVTEKNRDMIFGDHGRLYPQFSTLKLPAQHWQDALNSRNFFAIDTDDSDGGQGDLIWGEEGDDLLLGQQGDDRMWGGSGDDDMLGGHNVLGGWDELGPPVLPAPTATAIGALLNPLTNLSMNDLMDGGSGDDAMAGDNAVMWRRGDDRSPRFRTLIGSKIYATDGDSIDASIVTFPDPTFGESDPENSIGRDIEILDHSFGVQADAQGRFGADVMAGGSDVDVMFGELGDDLMQGDGYITANHADPKLLDPQVVKHTIVVTDTGEVAPDADQSETYHFIVPEAVTDANDYMEGSGGNDLMYGNLGQDDMIGGSSGLFGLTSATERPDGSDIMFGGAGVDIARNHIGQAQENGTTHVITTDVGGNSRDSDFIMGDNANIYRLVEKLNVDANGNGHGDDFLEFNYDKNYTQVDDPNMPGTDPSVPVVRGTERIIVRAMQQLDYTLGGADFAGGSYDPVTGAANADNGRGDLIHGESGDDFIFGMTGSDVLFGEGQDDDIVGGYGNDWISGGTGQDGVIGDDGVIYTSRNSLIGEPLYGIAGLLATDISTKYSNGNALNELITTPGDIQFATINISGQLKKTADITPFSFDPDWEDLAQSDEFAGDDEFPDDDTNKPFADDIIFGGLGSDFLHGGSGDDAISGAEALPEAYAPTFDINGNPNGILDLGYTVLNLGYDTANSKPALINPGDVLNLDFNPGDALAFNPIDEDGQHLNNRFRAGEFFLYDEYDPRRPILLTATGELWNPDEDDADLMFEFLLNFEEMEGVVRIAGVVPKATGQQTETYPEVRDDGGDAIFGDMGNDWLVGGTGRDNVYGGWGNDLLNVDDDHDGHLDDNLANNTPETHPTYEDRAYGGAGRDVLIGNTGGDRLIDWVGEYNSFLVPYAPFGQASVSRTLMPGMHEFLYALSAADGADPTRYSDTHDGAPPPQSTKLNDPIPSRNGEPGGELGMVLQQDFAWQDQTGAPADPQAGNIPGGHRDVLRSASFSGPNSNPNNAGADGFFIDSGTWTVKSGYYQVEPEALGGSALSVFYVDQYVPSYFEMLSTITAVKPTAGYKSNAYVIFDYKNETDFKFAGINVSTNKLEIGHRTATGWVVDVQGTVQGSLVSDKAYNLLLSVNKGLVTLVVDNTFFLSYTFAPVVDNVGIQHWLNEGMVGLGADNSRARIDNVVVQRLSPTYTYTNSLNFNAGLTSLLGNPVSSGVWSLANGRYFAAAAGTTPAIHMASLPVNPSYVIDLSATFSFTGEGGLLFDQYATNDFKFVTLADGKLTLGHRTADGWFVDATVNNAALDPNIDYTLGLTLEGSTVIVTLNGAKVLEYAYNALVTDGHFGLLSRTGVTTFDTFTVKTDDPALQPVNSAPTMTSLTLSPVNVIQGNTLTLTGNGVADSDGTVSSVRFYRDVNGNGIFESATDQLLGTDADGSNGWSLTVSSALFPLGNATYFTYATDNSGLTSYVMAATGKVEQQSATPVTATFANNTPKAITDAGKITSTIVISNAGQIVDLNLKLSITHTRVEDLDVFLIAPDGTRIELFSDIGGTGDNFTNTVLDSDVAAAITGAAAPFTGTFRPVGNLDALAGKNLAGTWTLEITDDTRRETGTLQSWSLIAQYLPSGAPLTAAGYAGDESAAAPLAMGDLLPIAAVAIQMWADSGADTAELLTLSSITFEIIDLDGALLGLSVGGTIYIDVDAAGFGWFVDPTPLTNSEYHTSNDGLVAKSGSDADGRIDLLSTLVHEIGHALDRAHADGGVMDAVLATGERHVTIDWNTGSKDAGTSLGLSASSGNDNTVRKGKRKSPLSMDETPIEIDWL